MEFTTLFLEAGGKCNQPFDGEQSSRVEEYKCNSLINLALDVVKRDSEKVALLKLKGYERVDIERTRGKHSVVCRHWLKGMCMKGEFCDFLHQFVYSRMPPCRSIEKNTFCIDKLRGCCIFQHEEQQQTDGNDTNDNTNLNELSYIIDPNTFTSVFDVALGSVLPKLDPNDIKLSMFYNLNINNFSDLIDVKKKDINDYMIPGIHDENSNVSSTRIFMIKCNNIMNIYYSICYGIWSTSILNTNKLSSAFNEYDNVILIFSGNETGGFQGYAKMMTLPIPGLYNGIWGNKTSQKVGDNFRVKWIKQCTVDFDKLKHVTNPLNNNLPLKKSRDCTEIPINIAYNICNTLYNSPSDDLLKGTILNDWEKVDHSRYFDDLIKRNLLNTTYGYDYTPLT